MEGNVTNICSPDERSALTVSAFIGQLSMDKAIALMQRTFENMKPTSDLNNVAGSGWTGAQRSYIDSTVHPAVLFDALIAWSPHGFVLITWNEPVSDSEQRPPLYEHIFQSLALARPERSL